MVKRGQYFTIFYEFTNFSQNNQHSRLDVANNKCYITTRTKEERKKKVLPQVLLKMTTPRISPTVLIKVNQRKGEMTYDDAQYFWRKLI